MQLVWLFFISALVNLAIGLLSRPKTQQAPRAERIEVPTADADRAQVMFWGTCRLAGNVIWYGDYSAEEVTKSTSTLFGLMRTKSSLGWRYRVGMALSLSACNVDKILAVQLGKEPVYTTETTLNTTGPTNLLIDHEYERAEGQPLKDGMKGRLSFINQSAEASTLFEHPYLLAQWGAGNVPAYPGKCIAVWEGSSSVDGYGFISITGTVEPLLITAQRAPDISWFNADGNAGIAASHAATKMLGKSANPVWALAEILTTRIPGIVPNPLHWSMLKRDEFVAAAERVHAEGIGFSYQWEHSRPVGELINDLARLVEGNIYEDKRTGQVGLQLIREDDEPMLALDDDNVSSFDLLQRVSASSTTNQLTVAYVDINDDFQDREHIEQSGAGIAQLGAIRSAAVDFLGVDNATTAALLASREARKVFSALLVGRLTANLPAGTYLKPGDALSMVYTPKALAMRIRVTSIRYGDPASRHVAEIEFIEDVFRHGFTNGAVSVVSPTPGATGGPAPGAPQGAIAIACPRVFAPDDGLHLLGFALPSAAGAGVVFAWKDDTTDGSIVSPLLYSALSTNGVNYATATSFSLSLPNAHAAELAEISPANGMLLAIYMTGGDYEFAVAGQVTVSGNSVSATGVSRGCYGTLPLGGGHVLFIPAASVSQLTLAATIHKFSGGVSHTLPGTTPHYCLTARAVKNGKVSATVAQAPDVYGLTATTQSQVRPYSPGALKVNGVAGTFQHAGLGGSTVVSRASPATLSWSRRSRRSGNAGPLLTAMDDPELGVDTRVRVLHSGTVVYDAVVSGNSVSLDTSAWPLGYKTIELYGAIGTLADGYGSYVPSTWYINLVA